MVLAVAVSTAVNADDDVDLTHPPIVVRSRPVISRVRLHVIRPADVAVTSRGDILVADESAKVLFKVDDAEESILLGRDLDGIARIVDAPRRTSTHILLTGQGSGRVLTILDSGEVSEFAYLPFTPAGLGLDLSGNLLTASTRGEIFRFDLEGGKERLARLPEPVRDLVVDPMGTAIVLLQSGRIMSVFADGRTRADGYVPASATRLKLHPEGFVVALAEDAEERSILVRPTSQREEVMVLATVPRGTVAFAFDELGNLTLANTDLRAVTKVTSRFLAVCPHCSKRVPMVFQPPERKARRSF